MIKKYSRASEFTQDILDSQNSTFDKGWSCGWNIGDDNISFKRGYTSYVYSHPGQGKTVFVTESLLHLAKNDNLNVCIYSPETGGRSEIVWNLIQVYTGKRLYGKNAHKISKDEIEKAIEFIDKHFIILEHNPFSGKGNERFTVKDIFNQVHMAEREYDMKVDVLCIDPFNLLDRELDDDRKAIQDYV
jgi:replicative DNA helicase